MSTAAMTRCTTPLFAVVISLALPSTAWSQVATASEMPTTTRMMSLGGNAQALAQSTSGIFSNPAAMSLARVYHIDSSVLFDPSVNRWAFGGTVADTTRMVSAALSYTFWTQNGDTSSHTSHDVRLALSVALTEGVALGLTGRYINLGGVRSMNASLGPAYSGVTIDAGLVVRPWQFLTLAVTGYSLTNPDTALTPLSVGGGVAVTPIESLNLVVDTVWDLRTWDAPRMRLSGGAEFMLGHVPLRVGYLYDTTRLNGDAHTLTAGLGYIDTAFGIEASLRQDIVGGDQTTLMINARYFYRAL